MYRIVLAALLATLVWASSAPAATSPYAPLDRRGPGVDARPALTCTAGVSGARVQPVLLNPATGVDSDENFSWNHMRAFAALGIPFCAYDAPHKALGDIQTSGELLVAAIRRVHRMAGRRIAVVGHSQGGMSMRWALRFWPRTRGMVDDVVGFAASNHGTTARQDCSPGCLPAVWQQADDARFIEALNSRAETFAGVSYTEVYSHTDEVIRPPVSSALRTGRGRVTNVATQDLCPGDVQGHLLVGTVDPVAYALAIDALAHDGPADPRRVDRAVCRQSHQPGVDPVNLDNYLKPLRAAPGLLSVPVPGVNLTRVPAVKAEPPLRCYVFARCTDLQAVDPGAATCSTKRRFAVRLPAVLRSVRVTLEGRPLRLRSGRRVLVDLRRSGGRTVSLRVQAVRGGRPYTEVRRYRACRRAAAGPTGG